MQRPTTNERLASRAHCRAALVAAALGASTALASGDASAQETGFDRDVREARAAYDADDPERALAALRRAYGQNPSPGLLFNAARAHEVAGRFRTAIAFYDRFIELNPPAEEARVASEARLNAARLRAERERANPGRAATEDPTGAVQAFVTAPPPSAATGGGRRFTALHGVLFAGGGALIVGGSVTGGLALGAHSEYDANPTSETLERGRTLALTTDILLGVGIVAVGVGIVLYLAQPTGPAQPRTSASIPRPPGTIFVW